MPKRENKLPRDKQIVVDLLNFDFQQKPPRWLAWFFGRYELESETAKEIQAELREVLFLKDPNGKREYGPLAARAWEYPVKIYPVALENNKGIGTLIPDPSDPREHVYQAIIASVQDGSFLFLQQGCKNCGRFYWHRGDFCNLKCGREFNRKGSAERMRRLRRKQGRSRRNVVNVRNGGRETTWRK